MESGLAPSLLLRAILIEFGLVDSVSNGFSDVLAGQLVHGRSQLGLVLRLQVFAANFVKGPLTHKDQLVVGNAARLVGFLQELVVGNRAAILLVKATQVPDVNSIEDVLFRIFAVHRDFVLVITHFVKCIVSQIALAA